MAAKVDPRSPLTAEVAKAAKTNTDFPSFSEIPAAPADVRPRRLYGQQAAELEQARDRLDAATGPETWTLSNTEAFAGGARRAAGPELPAPARRTPDDAAAAQKERAIPPPPSSR